MYGLWVDWAKGRRGAGLPVVVRPNTGGGSDIKMSSLSEALFGPGTLFAKWREPRGFLKSPA
jgi:hypothetical protein